MSKLLPELLTNKRLSGMKGLKWLSFKSGCLKTATLRYKQSLILYYKYSSSQVAYNIDEPFDHCELVEYTRPIFSYIKPCRSKGMRQRERYICIEMIAGANLPSLTLIGMATSMPPKANVQISPLSEEEDELRTKAIITRTLFNAIPLVRLSLPTGNFFAMLKLTKKEVYE